MTKETDEAEQKALAKAVNDSGFPLQLGVQQIATGNRRWRLDLKEHAWSDFLTGDEKFIDLVISGQEHNIASPMRIVIEAKRASKTEWIFLREQEPQSPQDDNRLRALVRVLARSRTASNVFNQWFSVPFRPGTPDVSFCVIRRDGQRAQDMLEKVAAELVRATDALSAQEDELHSKERSNAYAPKWTPIGRVYVPMIVTTARLFVCDAPYEAVDLETGRMERFGVKEVDAVRFTKTFGSIAPKQTTAKNIQEFAEAGERTVFVVSAKSLDNFLLRLDFGNLDVYLKDALWPKE